MKPNIKAVEYDPSMTLEQVEEWWILRAWAHHKGNMVKISKSLKISRATLYRKIGRFRGKLDKYRSNNG